jgi:xylan 1,4-beta-xylosidase
VQDAKSERQRIRTPPLQAMRRRTLLRKLAEGLALAVGHSSCRASDTAPAGPASKARMSLSVPPPPSAPPPIIAACDLAAPARPLRHPWRHCVGSCHAPLALRADWQQQLARAHRELGFRHVRFHGLLSDDMGTLVNQDDQFLFSFFNIDRVFDFLLSIGMKPLVELSFMPATLSSDGNSVFHYRANVTPPRRMADWQLLMTKLVGHWVERYGVDEVAQWPLEVWNEPNLVAFWTGGQAKYFELFQATWTAVKAISPRLQVGGPATAANAWLAEFNAFCAANACPPDFLSTHYYPTDAFGSVDTDTVSQLADAPPGVMRDRALEARAAAGAKPLYYTE